MKLQIAFVALCLVLFACDAFAWKAFNDQPGRHTEKKKAPSDTMVYHGGPIVQNAHVAVVLWNNKVVNGNSYGAFFQYILPSQYVTWLSTAYNAGKYKIGAGTYLGTYTLKPAKSTGTLYLNDIHTQMENAFKAGSIPKNVPFQSVYFIYFPPGITLSLDLYPGIYPPAVSCVSGGFCGIHLSNFSAANGNTEYVYALIPDMSTGGCAQGCAYPYSLAGNALATSTETSSHELIEIITDPSFYTSAWYSDKTGEEVADVCGDALMYAQMGGYWVADIWNNKLKKCQD